MIRWVCVEHGQCFVGSLEQEVQLDVDEGTEEETISTLKRTAAVREREREREECVWGSS